jgi:uncharacterized protein (UPF0332 family)
MGSDVEGIESLELTSADANAAHFTMVFVKNEWFIAFDFRYNAARVAEAVATAREFLDAATESFKRSQMRAFVDNLFSAVELLAKATLLLTPEKGILEGKRHGAIAAPYNRWGHMGNVDKRYVTLLNQLSKLRVPARYPPGGFTLAPDGAERMLTTAEEMYTSTAAGVPPRAEVKHELLPPWLKAKLEAEGADRARKD